MADGVGRRAFAGQHPFVTHDDPLDGAGFLHGLLERVDFLLVALLVLAHPDTGRQVQAGLLDQRRDLRPVGTGIGTDAGGELREDLEILEDRGIIGILAFQRIVPALGRVVGQAADLAVEGRGIHHRIDLVPDHEIQHGDEQCQKQCAQYPAHRHRVTGTEVNGQ